MDQADLHRKQIRLSHDSKISSTLPSFSSEVSESDDDTSSNNEKQEEQCITGLER